MFNVSIRLVLFNSQLKMFLPHRAKGGSFHGSVVPPRGSRLEVEGAERVTFTIRILRHEFLGLDHLDVQVQLWRLLKFKRARFTAYSGDI